MRCSNVIDNCEPSTSKLLNEFGQILRYEEKNVDWIMEIFSRFLLRPRSYVMDFFGGTMTTALACLRMNHYFIGFERDAYMQYYNEQRLMNVMQYLLENSKI